MVNFNNIFTFRFLYDLKSLSLFQSEMHMCNIETGIVALVHYQLENKMTVVEPFCKFNI